MANMSYCRFQNTLLALRDCKEALEDATELPDDFGEEHWAMLRLIEICQDIAHYNANPANRPVSPLVST